MSELTESLKVVEETSDGIDSLVNELVNKVCKSLDSYMTHIDSILCSSTQEVPSPTLETLILDLPAIIYFTSEGREKILIREEISKEVQRQIYTEARKKINGTVVDKDLYAKSNSSVQALTTLIYHSAYNRIKAKEEGALEMLNSLKKVMNRRVAELELSRGVRN